MSSDSVFRQLLGDKDNSRCFDCYRSIAHWASVSHGIFLCMECSGKHRGLGTHISFVRSINMDRWSDIQLNMMRNGGNRRFREFLSSFELSTSCDLMQRYYTKAADYYRQLLKAESEGRTLNLSPPGQTEGIEPFMQIPKSNYSAQASNYDLYNSQSSVNHDKNSSELCGNTKNFIGGVFEKTNKMANNTTNSFMEQGFLGKLKDATITTLVKSKQMIEDIKESDSYNSVKQKSKQMISAVSHQASNFFSKSRGKQNYESFEDFTFGGYQASSQSVNIPYPSQLPLQDDKLQRLSLFQDPLPSQSVPVSQSYFPSRNSTPFQFPESSPNVAIRNTVQTTDFMRSDNVSSSNHSTLDLLTGD